MRKILCAVTLILAGLTSCFAGYFGYYDISFIYFDESLNLSYISVAGTGKKGKLDFEKIVNVAVYDIAADKTKYIFPENNAEVITGFIFEKEIDAGKKRVLFNSPDDDIYSHLEDNSNVMRKSLSNNIIIKTVNRKTEEISFWLCSRNGSNLTLIYKRDGKTPGFRWFINPQKQKIVFINRTDGNIDIKDFDY